MPPTKVDDDFSKPLFPEAERLGQKSQLTEIPDSNLQDFSQPLFPEVEQIKSNLDDRGKVELDLGNPISPELSGKIATSVKKAGDAFLPDTPETPTDLFSILSKPITSILPRTPEERAFIRRNTGVDIGPSPFDSVIKGARKVRKASDISIEKLIQTPIYVGAEFEDSEPKQ